MPIPNKLISNNIRNAPYYNAYLEVVAKHEQKVAAKKEGKKKTVSAKQLKSMPAIEKSSKLAPAPKLKATKERPSKASTTKPPKPKPAKEKSTKTTPPQKAGKGKITEVRKVKSPFQLVDEPDEEPSQSEPEPELEHQGEGDEDDMERAIHMTSSTKPSIQAQDNTSANIVCDSPSPVDAETCVASKNTNSEGETEILQIDKEKGKDVDKQVNLKEKTDELDQGQAGSEPGRTLEAQPPPEQVFIDEDHAGLDPGESGRALAGLDPEPTHNEFMVDLYPKVQESLKFPADEHVILEDLISSTGTLSSMKNLEDAYAIGDQFINDKSIEDVSKKTNVKAEVVSMVTVPIYQASSSLPLLSTPIPTLNNTSRNLGSKVFTLELRDLPHKIDEAVCESVREVVHMALQASLYDCFRELPEADMKEILHQHMFETGTYRSLPEHVALYESLEAFIEQANRDELLTEIDKSPSSSSVISIEEVGHSRYSFKLLQATIRKGSGQALSISKMKVARYLDFGLELLVVRTHMRILSVVSIKAYSRYGYDYLKEITLHRADYQEYMIAEKDFKDLYPSDFEDLNLLLLQGHLNHLPGSDKCMTASVPYAMLNGVSPLLVLGVVLWAHNTFGNSSTHAPSS
nr:hypothetical protein [Tanacetum cinerariifolium]